MAFRTTQSTIEAMTKATPKPFPDVTNKSIEFVFGIVVMVLNIAEIVLISRLKGKKKIYEVFLISLSCADLLFGLSSSVKSVVYLTKNARYDDVDEISYTLYFFFVLTSILHLTWMALDRVWAVYSPMKHNIHVTKKRVVILIIITWVLTSIIGTSMYVYYEYGTSGSTSVKSTTNTTQVSTKINITKILPPTEKENYPQQVQLALTIFIILADTVFICSYGFIIYLVKRKKEFTSATQSAMEDKVSLVCVFIATVFVLFTMPYALARLFIGRTPTWANVILVSNSGMNCVVYFFRGKYEAYLDKKRKIKQREGTTSETSLNIIRTPDASPVSTPTPTKKTIHESQRKSLTENTLSPNYRSTQNGLDH